MESCTGGYVAISITDVTGASEVLKFSVVTYSVYSKEVAREMAKNISLFAGSNYGIGITEKINRQDKNNMYGDNNKKYILENIKNSLIDILGE